MSEKAERELDAMRLFMLAGKGLAEAKEVYDGDTLIGWRYELTERGRHLWANDGAAVPQ